MSVRFCKYSALGNEYLVLAQPRFADHLNESNVRHICDSDNGPGADGVLAVYSPPGGVGVHIWNADGSKAEKSGNGLRIFARYLWDRGDVGDDPVHILTAGGEVQAIVLDRGNRVRVEMGQVTVQDDPLVIRTDPEEVLECTPASVGNPHCVCFVDAPTAQLARSLGPSIERHEAFPNRTNVQFVSVISRSEIRMEVWERGSGYTLSSGSSAVAATAVCRRRGLVDQAVSVIMPGGTLAVSLDENDFATMEGPVCRLDDTHFPNALFA